MFFKINYFDSLTTHESLVCLMLSNVAIQYTLIDHDVTDNPIQTDTT